MDYALAIFIQELQERQNKVQNNNSIEHTFLFA